jgi:hypothetical protein
MPMPAKPNYAFEKRQRELAKKRKKEEKSKRKEESAQPGSEPPADSAPATEPAKP